MNTSNRNNAIGTNRSRVHSIVLAAAVLAMFARCGPQSNQDVRGQSESPDNTRKVQLANPIAEDDPKPPLPNLVQNGSFENRDESGRPLGWAVSPPEILVPENSPVVYPFDGGDYVTLRSVDDAFGILAYTLPLEPEHLGRTVVATVQGRAPLWRYMFLTIRYTVDGEYVENLHEWPACPDTWTENIARETIPLEADPSSVQVRILIRDDGGYTFCVDHVRAFVLDQK